MISVVLCVYNEEDNIRACLESLKNQTYNTFELIVVDDGSTDNTMNIVKEFEDEFEMSVFNKEHVGLRKARRFGVSKAKGEIIFTIDADEVFDEKFIEQMIGHFENENVGVVGGYMKTYGDNWVAKGLNSLRGLFYRYRDWASGGCMAFRKELRDFLSIETVGADVDFSWEAKRRGYRIVLDKGAVVYHKDPLTLPGVVTREYIIGKRTLNTFFRHKKYFNLNFWFRFLPFLLIIFLVIDYKISALLFVIYSFPLLLSLKRDRSYGYVLFFFMNLGWVLGILRSLVEKDIYSRKPREQR